jgi:ADP-heptose:LPS heptosyltransferase
MVDVIVKEKYDYILDLHHNLRTQRLRLSLRRHFSSFPKLNFEKWLYVRFRINLLPDLHIVQRYFAAGKKLGIANDDKGLDFFIPEENKVNISEVFGFSPGTYTSIVIGAAHATKCLTANQIATLCEKLAMPVILLGGTHESTKAQWIINISKSSMIKNACGGFDILQSASILQQAGTVITHDTGLMHIAAALKKPQVVIWGNTIPQFGMFPYYGVSKVKWISFERPGLKCRPCSKLGFEKCPQGHFKCILDHDLDEVVKAAKEIMT